MKTSAVPFIACGAVQVQNATEKNKIAVRAVERRDTSTAYCLYVCMYG